MKALNKLTVRAVLTLCFLAVAVIAAVIGLFGANALDRVGDLAGQMNNRETAAVYHVGQADAYLIAVGSSARSAILAQTTSERDFEISMVDEHFQPGGLPHPGHCAGLVRYRGGQAAGESDSRGGTGLRGFP